MLTSTNRDHFATLLDAVTFMQADDTPAVIYVATDAPTITLTRADFSQHVRTMAGQLAELGIVGGDLVVIAHTQNLECMIAFWALIMIGARPSMFPTLTEKLDAAVYYDSMAQLVARSDVTAVLTSDDFAPSMAEVVTCPVYASATIADQTPRMVKRTAPSPDEIAFLQHSSGTTGLQKGVALSHQAVLNQIASYSDAIALNAGDVIVSWLPLYHDMGLIAGFILPLMQGIPLVLMSPFDWVTHPAMLLRAIHDYRGTLCWLPNFAYNHCARRIRQRDSAGYDLSSMRMFINCSEPVYASSHAQFVERFAGSGVRHDQLAVSYAMAENTFAVTQTAPGQLAEHDIIDRERLQTQAIAEPVPVDHPHAVTYVRCGHPITGTQVQVIDDDGVILPERHVGELIVRSDCMLTEYYRRPDLAPFVDGWYRTGDRGYIVDGQVVVIGRSKDLIINAGKNVFPQDVEAVINTVDGVHAGRVVVFGVPDEREGTELIAAVIETQPDADTKAITRAVKQAVARALTVTLAYVTVVDSRWLIKTSSGKIARAANRDKWLSERA